jgi:hypothetical protein
VEQRFAHERAPKIVHPLCFSLVHPPPGLFLAWHGLTYWEVDRKCEKPKYALIKTIETGSRSWYGAVRTVEVRRYAPYIIAAFTADANAPMRESLGKGFMSVAGYIFGKNQSKSGGADKVAMTSPVVSEKVAMTSPVVSEKVAMTSPVVSEKVAMTSPVVSESAGEANTVSFIMPSKYTMDTLPTPVDPRVTLKEVPSRTLAALRWRGPSVKEEVMQSYASELREVLEREGLKIQRDEPVLFQYHPPFAPPWMRINEVLFEIKE